MVSRKYIHDYKFSETVTKRGRIRTEAVYVGPLFRHADEKAAARIAEAMPLPLLIAWLAYFAAFLPQSAASHRMFVIVPFAFAALPLGRLTGSLALLRSGKDTFIRSEAEKLFPRVRDSAATGMILAGASLFGETVGAVVRSDVLRSGDAIFSLCAAAVAVCCLILLRMGKRLSLREEEGKSENCY